MSTNEFTKHITRTLLYYEIFEHPLSAGELFLLFPKNSLTKTSFGELLEDAVEAGTLKRHHGFYTMPTNGNNHSRLRIEREPMARWRMWIARFMAHIIKRFPFVRGIFISGDLSKGVSNPKSDIDYVIVTEPHRLWICRTLLVLFKKIILLNSRKYFCLNYYIDTQHLTLQDRNYFTATEIAHLKPLHNFELYLKYLNANIWIKRYFPNYRGFGLNKDTCNSRPSILQKFLELFLQAGWADRLDLWLMEMMVRVWKKRYPEYDDATRERIFRCSEHESRAYVGNFSDIVMSLYENKLSTYNLL